MSLCQNDRFFEDRGAVRHRGQTGFAAVGGPVWRRGGTPGGPGFAAGRGAGEDPASGRLAARFEEVAGAAEAAVEEEEGRFDGDQWEEGEEISRIVAEFAYF